MKFKNYKYLAKIIIIGLIISANCFARSFTYTAGIIDRNTNSINNFKMYYQQYDNRSIYFKYNLYMNRNVGNLIELGNNISIYYPYSKSWIVTSDLNFGFSPSYYPALIAYKKIGAYYKNLYLGIQHNRYTGNTELGINISLSRNWQIKYPIYISVGVDINNQTGLKESHEKFEHIYKKFNYECGIRIKNFRIGYYGYYTNNHRMFLEESVRRNYLILKILFPKKNNSKYWSVNFFTGNTYDIDVHNESKKYRKTISNTINGISLTF